MPKFQHDCTACIFLGHFEDHDLYYCDREPTVIARFGDDGPQYGSGLAFANHPLSDLDEACGPGSGRLTRLLRVAWLLAKDAGVVSTDPEKVRVWHPTR